MKHFPARTYPARIGAHLEDDRPRASWVIPSRRALLETLACCALGLVAGAVLALGYLADPPAWLR